MKMAGVMRPEMVSGLLLAMLVGLAVATATVGAASDNAFLVVHKSARISKGKAKSERITVDITVYNAGSSTAYDVVLNDETWPVESFSLVSGNQSHSWEKLDAGGAVLHAFGLEPKVKGFFKGAPAVVKYRVAANSKLQEAWSTPIFELDVLADKPAQNKIDWIKKVAIAYGPLVLVLSFVGLFAYVLITPSKSKKYSGKKRR